MHLHLVYLANKTLHDCLLLDLTGIGHKIVHYHNVTLHVRATAVTTEIPLKECSAYGQIDQGGDEREEPHIYERPQ